MLFHIGHTHNIKGLGVDYPRGYQEGQLHHRICRRADHNRRVLPSDRAKQVCKFLCCIFGCFDTEHILFDLLISPLFRARKEEHNYYYMSVDGNRMLDAGPKVSKN